MHTFRDRMTSYEVGYWAQNGDYNEFMVLFVVSYKVQALLLVNFLNGGTQQVDLVNELVMQEDQKHGR